MVINNAMPGKKLIQYLPDSRCVKPLEMSRPSEGEVIGMTSFGASAPLKDLLTHFGFTVDNVVAAAKRQLAR